MSFLPCSRERLIIPHEKFGIFLKDLLRDLAGHGDDGRVVAFLPSLLEPGSNRLQAFLFGFTVLLELAHQGPFAQLLQVTGLIRVGDVPAVLAFGLERRIILGQAV